MTDGCGKQGANTIVLKAEFSVASGHAMTRSCVLASFVSSARSRETSGGSMSMFYTTGRAVVGVCASMITAMLGGNGARAAIISYDYYAGNGGGLFQVDTTTSVIFD